MKIFQPQSMLNAIKCIDQRFAFKNSGGPWYSTWTIQKGQSFWQKNLLQGAKYDKSYTVFFKHSLLPIITRSIMGDNGFFSYNGFYYYPLLTSPWIQYHEFKILNSHWFSVMISYYEFIMIKSNSWIQNSMQSDSWAFQHKFFDQWILWIGTVVLSLILRIYD